MLDCLETLPIKLRFLFGGTRSGGLGGLGGRAGSVHNLSFIRERKNSRHKSSGRLGYLTHYVVDGGKARVVLNVLVTGAEVTENLPMREMLFRSTFRWGLRPRSVTGDAAYGTRKNIAAIEKASIRAYAALPEQGKRTSLFAIDRPQQRRLDCKGRTRDS